jgi:signal transduction histidine kinase/HAMP domain-containing protein
MKYKTTKIPHFKGLRIYLLSIILYFLLVNPINSYIYIKNNQNLIEEKFIKVKTLHDSVAPIYDSIYNMAMQKRDSMLQFQNNITNDELEKIINEQNNTLKIKPKNIKVESPPPTQPNERNLYRRTESILPPLLILGLILGWIFNIPFKTYFRRKRRKAEISPRLEHFVKRTILKSPLYNAIIFIFPFIVFHIILLKLMMSNTCTSDALEIKFFRIYLIISTIASILVTMFLYSWQKHRVHLKYIDHIFTNEELQTEIFKIKRGSIGTRFFSTTILTTFLPLLIVMLYLFLSVSPVEELGIKDITYEQRKVLLGNYYSGYQINDEIKQSAPLGIFKNIGNLNNYYYINIIDTILVLLGIASSVCIAIIYIFFFVKWAKLGIIIPVNELLTLMHKSAEKNMEELAPVRSNDEIGRLALGYNQMSVKLKSYIDKIEKMNIDLENKVKERTAEIENQKEEIAAQRDALKEQNIAINAQKNKIEEAYHEIDVTLNQLKDTQSHLVQSEKMASLGLLTAGIAHEINNPINFVSANVNPLKKDIDDIKQIFLLYRNLRNSTNLTSDLQKIKKMEEALDIDYVFSEADNLLKGISEGANRTREIVLSLRNFARLDEAEIKATDIHSGIDSTLTLLNNKIKNRIKIVKNYGDVPEIECFPAKLNQVFMNILNNAADAIENSGTIVITTDCDESSATISIKDDGIGMTDETKQKIFEPFFTTKEIGKGVGLGLSITFSIIQEHKGKIEVNSTKDKGTEFIITLPLKQIND